MVADFQAYLLEEGFHRLKELVVAHGAAQHLHHDRALAGAESPVFGGIIFEAGGLNERHIIHRQGGDGRILHALVDRGGAFFVLRPERFGVKRHAVFKPHMIAVDGRDVDLPTTGARSGWPARWRSRLC